VDEDALAKKISAPIIAVMQDGFAMLAAALRGEPPTAAKKDEKAKDATSGVVPGTTPSGGPEPLPALEREVGTVDDSQTEPGEAR
jgi:hypothetical protein